MANCGVVSSVSDTKKSPLEKIFISKGLYTRRADICYCGFVLLCYCMDSCMLLAVFHKISLFIVNRGSSTCGIVTTVDYDASF